MFALIVDPPPIRKLENTPPGRLLDMVSRCHRLGATLTALVARREDHSSVGQMETSYRDGNGEQVWEYVRRTVEERNIKDLKAFA